MTLAAATCGTVIGSALAADMPVKAVKPPSAFEPSAFDPIAFERWDLDFGSSIASDYLFRGISLSNHQPSVSGFFEPRFKPTKDLQIYAGVAGQSVSFPNRAAAELDIYGGIRPTFSKFTLDIGVWGTLFPGGQCFNALAGPASGLPGSGADCVANGNLPNGLAVPAGFGNVIKRSTDYVELFTKGNIDLSEQWNIGVANNYSPNFLNLGAWGDYLSFTGKWTAPAETFGASGVGMYISGELAHQWLGTSDAFYGNGLLVSSYAAGIPLPSYNTWNLGVGFTYKVLTLDLRYSGTSLSKASCNALTGDFSATNASAAFVTPINPGTGAIALGSNWCGGVAYAKLSIDLNVLTSLK